MFSLAVIVVIVLEVVAAVDFHFDDSIFYPAFKDIFEHRCKKNSDSKTTSDILEFVKHFDECITDVNAPIPSIVKKDFLRYFCTDLYPNQNKCTKSLSEKIEPCLNSEEKFLKEFLYNTYKDSSDYLCQQSSLDYWKKELNLDSAVYCMIIQADVVKKCLQKAKLVKELSPSNSVISLPILCSGLKDFQNCVLKGLETPCKDAKVLEFFGRRYKSLTNSCPA